MGCIGRVRCEKSRRDFVARTFALIAPVHPILHRVSSNYKTIPNAPKHYETHENMSLGSNGVVRVCSLRKITTLLRGNNVFINCTSSPTLHWVSCSYETIPNAPKHYETHKNMSLESNGVDRVRSLQQILTRLCGTKFCINCTSSVCFAPSFMLLRNHPKWTQTLWNLPKHECWVQGGGSGAFVAKNSNTTSWHVSLH